MAADAIMPAVLRCPVTTLAGGNVPVSPPPTWSALLSTTPSAEYLAVEGRIDAKTRILAAELFGAIKNSADAGKAFRMVQWIEFAMSSASSGDEVEEMRYALKRKRHFDEKAAIKKKRVEEADKDDGPSGTSGGIAAVGGTVGESSGEPIVVAEGAAVDETGAAKGKEAETIDNTTITN